MLFSAEVYGLFYRKFEGFTVFITKEDKKGTAIEAVLKGEKDEVNG